MKDDQYIKVMSDLIDMSKQAPAGSEILVQCLEIAALLLEKNISYGNSALEPIQIFSKANAGNQIDIKIDDKLSRIKRGSEFPGEDTVLDLCGYLVLKLIHDKRVRMSGGNNGTQKED
jgi:hypothetical protein